ncbi:MAG TPA: hypothetical protein VFQ74_03750 [Pseudolysinimonas sp.]|nr:hypothetical protein [Pseudolysinimonas sp.]
MTESSTLETRRLATCPGANLKHTQVVRSHAVSVLSIAFIIPIGADIAHEDSREPRNGLVNMVDAALAHRLLDVGRWAFRHESGFCTCPELEFVLGQLVKEGLEDGAAGYEPDFTAAPGIHGPHSRFPYT